MTINGHTVTPPPRFFEFKLAHLIQIIVLIGFVAAWWVNHESVSAVANTTQSVEIASLERRMDELEKMRDEVVPDIREVKTKINVIAELIDGEHKRPELHK